MKKTLKKSLAVILALITVMTTLLISPLSANAATPVQLEGDKIAVWADPEGVLTQAKVEDFNSGTSKITILGGIQPFQIATRAGIGSIGGGGTGNYYMFLPSTADCSNLSLWVANGSTLTINGTAITSGVPTNIFAELNEGGISKDYTFKLNSSSYTVTVMKSGDVGAIYIDTASGSLSNIYKSKDNFETGTIMVVQPDGKVDYMGELSKMSGRGNGTWNTDSNKNPYNIKLAKSTSLLGMSSAKKWCLLMNNGDGANDPSLVKNQLTYDFADYIGIKFQPHCKPVDLYVNQQYLGSYQLAEKVEIKTKRINITDAYENLEIANGTVDANTGAIIPADFEAMGTKVQTDNTNPDNQLNTTLGNKAAQNIGSKKYSSGLQNPTDITGGYLYELEISKRWVDENAGFCAYNRQGWVMKSADYATKEMVDYSYNLLYALGSSVYNGGTVPKDSVTVDCTDLYKQATSLLTKLNLQKETDATGSPIITNPAPAEEYQGKKWSNLLDADSAVRYYWTQEFFKNMDSSTSSTYFYKDSDSIDGKLYAGPMWDMDNSLYYNASGDSKRWGYSYTSTDGWYTRNARIYRWRSEDSTMSYSKDTQSPLNFYAALATNCPDFWSMAQKYWYNTISPAVDIILGNKIDETGKLKSISEYVNTVSKSAKMDAVRHSLTYDTASVISGMENWVSARQTWINGQFSTIDMSSVNVQAPADQMYTGKAVTPALTVTYNDSALGTISLEEGKDYTVAYSNNTEVGTATAVVTGINGYTGSKTVNFNITANALASDTLTIENYAYANMQLNAVLTDADGNDFTDLASYQWYRNGAAISGAAEKSYVTTADDVGSAITVAATGDGKNLTGSLTSNSCTVLAGERPQGFSKTIAAWDYDYTADSAALKNADSTNATFYYTATSGEKQTSSNLYASVNTTDLAEIKWSGSADLYSNDGVKDQAPVMGTSKKNNIGWGPTPYFETVVPTSGYESIKFSAKLGGTNSGPSDWKLQYSLDGKNYTDIANTSYMITKNKNMELAFDNVALPAECDNQKAVYIRMVALTDWTISGAELSPLNGDAAVNNIKVTGASLSVITSLDAPAIISENVLFSDSKVVLQDNNGGADVYYTVNGGEPILYTGEFNPFDAKTAKLGDTVTIAAYAQFNDIKSDEVTSTFNFGGVNINSFSYNTYSTDVTAGAVQSSGGVYGQSGKMTAYTDGKSQYVPLWNDKNGAFSVAPDDGALWSDKSGFTYKVSTAGYENVTFSCKAYTTTQGPKSITLQYSTDGVEFINVESNKALPAAGVLDQLFLTADLPAECDNRNVLYLRLATTEDLTLGGAKLHNNASHGNLYVNDVVVAGEDDGTFKMPYTNKSTQYFGDTGTVKYVSPDGLPMQFAVLDGDNNVVMSGTYPELGIQLSSVKGFDKTVSEPYTIIIQAVDDEETSIANAATYYYKGSTVVKFNYSDKYPIANYLAADGLSVNNTDGANSGTLSMYPDSENAASLTYTGTYGVKVEWDAATNVGRPYAATKKLDNPDGNGYWLIETSTLGYTDLTLNLEQLSSNRGPRDWGVAYSTNGRNFTYVENSNVRAVSNDITNRPIETYGNLPLPSECDNQEKLYIKIFINGGEDVKGDELEFDTKGNTGINGVEISGIALPVYVDFNTTLLESSTAQTGSINVSNVDIYVNGSLKATTDENGKATVGLAKGEPITVEFKGDGIAARTVVITADGNTPEQNVPLMAYDVNHDGYVNAKDYAIITKEQKYSSYEKFFQNFINVKTNEFTY